MGQWAILITGNQTERSELRTHVPNSVSSLLASAGAVVNSNFMTRGLTRIIEVWSCNCVTAAARVMFEGSGETFVMKERDMVFGSGRRAYRRRPSLLKAQIYRQYGNLQSVSICWCSSPRSFRSKITDHTTFLCDVDREEPIVSMLLVMLAPAMGGRPTCTQRYLMFQGSKVVLLLPRYYCSTRQIKLDIAPLINVRFGDRILTII